MTKQEILDAAQWEGERNGRLAEISRLQQEYGKFEATCKHWSSRSISNGPPETGHYEICEWCGQEVNP